MAKNPLRLASHFELGHVRESHAVCSKSVYGAEFVEHMLSDSPDPSERVTCREFQHGEHFDLQDGVSPCTFPESSYNTSTSNAWNRRDTLTYPIPAIEHRRRSHIRVGDYSPDWSTSNREYQNMDSKRMVPRSSLQRSDPVNNVFPLDARGSYESESKAAYSRSPLQESTFPNRWVNSGKKNVGSICFTRGSNRICG